MRRLSIFLGHSERLFKRLGTPTLIQPCAGSKTQANPNRRKLLKKKNRLQTLLKTYPKPKTRSVLPRKPVKVATRKKLVKVPTAVARKKRLIPSRPSRLSKAIHRKHRTNSRGKHLKKSMKKIASISSKKTKKVSQTYLHPTKKLKKRKSTSNNLHAISLPKRTRGRLGRESKGKAIAAIVMSRQRENRAASERHKAALEFSQQTLANEHTPSPAKTTIPVIDMPLISLKVDLNPPFDPAGEQEARVIMRQLLLHYHYTKVQRRKEASALLSHTAVPSTADPHPARRSAIFDHVPTVSQ